MPDDHNNRLDFANSISQNRTPTAYAVSKVQWLSENSSALLLAFGFVATVVALVRLWVSYRRATIARLDNLQNRFQKGTEMFGATDTATFLAGLYELQQLAKRYPKNYHITVMKVLSGYVRGHVRACDVEKDANLPDFHDPARERVTKVLNAIGDRAASDIKEEHRRGYRVDLSGVDARAMQLPDCNFSGINASGSIFSQAILDRAVFRSALLVGTKFNGATLQSANLSGTNLEFAKMAGADISCGSLAGSHLRWMEMPRSLYMCNLSDARMFEVTGLTQNMLDTADGWIRTPPSIIASLDPETGDELRWNGGNKRPVFDVAAAYGCKRATPLVERILARLLAPRPPAEEVIESNKVTNGLRFFVQRIGQRSRGAKYVVFQWERQTGSSRHTKIYEGDHRDSALASLQHHLDKHRVR